MRTTPTLIAFVALLAVIAGVARFGTRTPGALEDNPRDALIQTYSNAAYGYSFAYPSDAKLLTVNEPSAALAPELATEEDTEDVEDITFSPATADSKTVLLENASDGNRELVVEVAADHGQLSQQFVRDSYPFFDSTNQKVVRAELAGKEALLVTNGTIADYYVQLGDAVLDFNVSGPVGEASLETIRFER